MEFSTFTLVLASTATHAYWNFLIKRAGGGPTFIGLSKLLEVIVFAPAFAWWAIPHLRQHLGAWPLVVGGALLTLASYAALGRAYQLGELSLAYPVARGGTLLFLPLFGHLAFGERVSTAGWVSLACILLGIALLQRSPFACGAASAVSPGRGRRSPPVVFALLAALAAAAYTTWDKWAVQTLPPFAYFYAYTALVAAAYGAFMGCRQSVAELRAELGARWRPMLQVGVLNTVGYLLVLLALREATSSYVIATRQLSIAIGAVLGWRLLGESFGGPRALGVALIVAGCVLAGLAR